MYYVLSFFPKAEMGTRFDLKRDPKWYKLTLLDLSGEQLVHPGMDMACIPSIFIKTSQIFFDESCLISAFTKIFFGKLRMLKVGPRGR